MARTPIGIARRCLLAVSVAALLSSCAVDPATVPGLTATPTNPCGSSSGTTFGRGTSSHGEGDYATFTTDGTGLWVTGSGYLHGAVFDPRPGEGRSGLYVGLASTPPRYDAQTGQMSSVVVESDVYEGWWTWLDLPQGDYSILTGATLDLEVQTCREGSVSNVVPAPPNLGAGVTWTATEPCEGTTSVTVELGDPRLQPDTWAAFSTDGTGFWVTARGYRHETINDPEVGAGYTYVWNTKDPPPDVPGIGPPEGFAAVKPLREGGWTLLDIPAGDYWLTATDAADIVVTSCEPDGVAGATPAPSPAS